MTTFEEQRERGCLSKVRFSTIVEAEGQAAFLNKYSSTAPELRAYGCWFCYGFHLTSNVQDGDRED